MTFNTSGSLIPCSAIVIKRALAQLFSSIEILLFGWRWQCCGSVSLFVCLYSIFSCGFPPCFSSIIPVVTRCTSFFLLITFAKISCLAFTYFINEWFSCVCLSSYVSFDFSANHEIRSIHIKNHISVPLVCIVAALKLSRSYIHTPELAQYNTPMLFSLCWWKCLH